jgi:hypothetical protein
MDYKEYLKTTGETISASNLSIPNAQDFIQKIKSVKDGNYGQSLVSKSKFTVRGSLIVGAVGVALAMYLKKSLLFGALIGIVTGTMIGHVIGTMIEQKNLTKTNAK